jgi:lysophospholipase L1-like esterase
MPLHLPRSIGHPVFWIALLAAAATAGCAVWRVGTSKELAKASEPFQVSPAGATASLLVIGDSTAVGTGASDGRHSLSGLVAASHPQLRVVNKAADGARYAEFARQLEGVSERFDTVLVLGGGNDVIRFTNADQLRSDVQRVAELAHERGRRVILMPPGNVGNAPFFFPPLSWLMDRRSQQLHRDVQEAARSTGARYVGMYKDAKSDPFAHRPKELHAADGLHPSNAGYELWAKELGEQGGL